MCAMGIFVHCVSSTAMQLLDTFVLLTYNLYSIHYDCLIYPLITRFPVILFGRHLIGGIIARIELTTRKEEKLILQTHFSYVNTSI